MSGYINISMRTRELVGIFINIYGARKSDANGMEATIDEGRYLTG
jgi:hypothetical protein